MTLHPQLQTINKLRRKAHRSQNLYGSLDPVILRHRLRRQIINHGSVKALAAASGVSFGYIYKLQRGTKDNPSINTLRKLGLAK